MLIKINLSTYPQRYPQYKIPYSGRVNKIMKEEKTRGTLEEKEYHPSADKALLWYKNWALDFERHACIKEALASTAMSGNRLSEILFETIERLDSGRPVSDRYLLGLCWYLRDKHNEEEKKKETIFDKGFGVPQTLDDMPLKLRKFKVGEEKKIQSFLFSIPIKIDKNIFGIKPIKTIEKPIPSKTKCNCIACQLNKLLS